METSSFWDTLYILQYLELWKAIMQNFELFPAETWEYFDFYGGDDDVMKDIHQNGVYTYRLSER